jgi:hypothetical protein
MTEMVTSGSMSGEGKRSDGLLGESDPETCCSHSAPPALHATALLFDSTSSAVGEPDILSSATDVAIWTPARRIHNQNRPTRGLFVKRARRAPGSPQTTLNDSLPLIANDKQMTGVLGVESPLLVD